MKMLEIVIKFKSNKSPEFDDVNICKKVIVSISEPLTYIFDLSKSSGIMPDNLKVAKVIPIFKEGRPSFVKDYRPISVLPLFSRVIECLVFYRLYTFLTNHNIFFSSQFGFRSSYSTYMAVIDLVDKVARSFDDKEHGFWIFF